MNWIIYISVIAIIAIWLINAGKNKSKYGINIKRVVCPNCNTKQPIVRMPQNSRQFMYGGTTCPGCQTELDKYGNVL